MIRETSLENVSQLKPTIPIRIGIPKLAEMSRLKRPSDGQAESRPMKQNNAPTENPGRTSQSDFSDVPALGAIIGYKLRRAQLAVFQDFIDSFTKMKLRPAEFSVLALIARTPGQKQSEIALQLGIKRANFVSLMDGLERRGLAERRKATGDKRSHSLHLTPEGARFVRRMTDVWRQHEQRLIERLGGTRDRDALIALLDRLIDASGN